MAVVRMERMQLSLRAKQEVYIKSRSAEKPTESTVGSRLMVLMFLSELVSIV